MAFSGGNLFGLFRRPKRTEESLVRGRDRSLAANPPTSQRIISFRINADLDRKLSRALGIRSETRSDFIRNAIERALQQDAQARLRAAHAAISWD